MATCTTSYGNTYEFSFERESDGTVRTYIDRQPSYGSRSSESSVVHRIQDGNRYYVCVREESKPRTVAEARVVAEEWAKCTDRYIRSGVSFDRLAGSPVRVYAS